MIKKKIGLLFSQLGTTANVEKGQLQTALLAIEEINHLGTVLIEPVIGDPQSDPKIAAREAYRLFSEFQIDCLVGSYTSTSRKAVIPVLNQTGGLMLYPPIYEGSEMHPNIFYCGAIPNQQIEPMMIWSVNTISIDFVLIGSDYIYPNSINKQIKAWLRNVNGTVLHEEYVPLGHTDFEDTLTKINEFRYLKKPIVVLSTLVGTSIISFYQQYKKANLPFSIVSPVTSEIEFCLMGKDAASGHYCSSSYFQDVEKNLRNDRFKSAYRRNYGNTPINREMAATYDAIYLLYYAYQNLSSRTALKVHDIRKTLKTTFFTGLQGKVIMEPRSQHLWQWSRIGRAMPDGKIRVEWSSPGPMPPRHTIWESIPTINLKAESSQERDDAFSALIGQSDVLTDAIAIARIAARNQAPVLISGKSGTGKELFAKAIHESGNRKQHPFISINCAAIPPDLIAAELFGYETGAFTGAVKGGRKGKFELAEKGTLFLDEVGEMPLECQVHLLRVLQEKTFYRVGGNTLIDVDVRVLSATNKNLSKVIAENGPFRSDLFYRLNLFTIDLPDLKERQGDIPTLSLHFLTQLNESHQCRKQFCPEYLYTLTNHDWPGNVRELKNVIERSFYMASNSDVISLKHLSDIQFGLHEKKIKDHKAGSIGRTGANGSTIECTTDRYSEIIDSTDSKPESKKQIEQALKVSGYNVSMASRLLGISRSTVYRKIMKYDIDLNRIVNLNPKFG